jgi:hypothetical protein
MDAKLLLSNQGELPPLVLHNELLKNEVKRKSEPEASVMLFEVIVLSVIKAVLFFVRPVYFCDNFKWTVHWIA